MDFKEKLENAANQYEEESIYGGMEALYDTKYAFKQGAEWLQSQPLADRLTEEEMALFRELYACSKRYENLYRNKGLFGQEMFETE